MLERLNRPFGVPVLRPTVQGGQLCLQATEFVGVFRFGNPTIQVLPKIYQSAEHKAEEARRNLLQMLGYASQFPIRKYELTSLLSHHTSSKSVAAMFLETLS